jgi:ribosomal protein S18 acetylase RimI-like enzyme
MTMIIDQLVRPASTHDRAAVQRMIELLARQNDAAADISDAAKVFVAKCDEKIIGVIAVSMSAGTAQISHLYVLENFRRCGIATALVHAVIDALPPGTLLELSVPTRNTDARLFYLAVGFQRSEFSQMQMVT